MLSIDILQKTGCDTSKDSIQNVLSFSKLRALHGTGRAVHVSGTGKNKKFIYRRGIACEMGDLEISEWSEAMTRAICAAEENELFQDLLEYVQNNIHWLHSEAERKLYALKLHAERIFDNLYWTGYLSFNRQYRPNILEETDVITVIPECCRKPGQITKVRYDMENGEAGYCPHCGQWTNFVREDEHGKE